MVQYSPKYASQIIGIMALICLSSFTQQPPKSKSKSFKEIQIIAYAWEMGEKKDYLSSKLYAYMDSTGRCQILKLQKGVQPSYQAFAYTLTPKEFGELSESIEQLQSDTTLATTANAKENISKRFCIKKSNGQAVHVQFGSPIQRTIYESIYEKIDSATNISRFSNMGASSQLLRKMRSKAREIYRLEHAKHIKRHKIPFEGCILINPIEKMAEFPGGNDSIFCFIESRLKHTLIYRTNAKGRVYASFRITKKGNVEDIRIISRLHTDSGEEFTKDSVIQNEITRVIKQFPRWKPAEENGQKVSSGYTIPISIPYIISKCRCINDTSFVMMPDTVPNFIYGSKPTLSERINDYVRENIQLIDDDIQGTIYVRATVDKNGSLKDLTLVNDLDPYYNNEALRLVKEMHQWEPAIKKGRPVKTAILIPIKILMQ